MAIAQDPESAQNGDMPHNAASSGNADHVLPPADMPGEISAYLQHLAESQSKSQKDSQTAHDVETVLFRICETLKEVTEHDFRHYKSSTLVRRVVRRMHVLRIETADHYLNRVRDDRDEAHALFRELLISVTSFFRDPDTFAMLAGQVIPKLFTDRKERDSIRVWVPGCATGEEAYSLAMLLYEEREQCGLDIEIQVFATDIDQRALNVARAASYLLSIAESLTESRLKRFFPKKARQYHVVKAIRDLCVFSVHNLVSDPPYSRMDMISCRNLLIYLGQHLQQKLIPLFHFALVPNGYLLLGPSENLATHTEIFREVDKKHRISQRKAGPASAAALLASSNPAEPKTARDAPASFNETEIHRVAQRIVLDEFAPRYAVVNDDGNLVCTSSSLERFFEFPEGPFRNNVLKLARPGLRSGLRAAFRQPQKSLRMVTRVDLTLKSGEESRRIGLVVQPMPEMGDDGHLFMPVFQDLGPMSRSHVDGNIVTADAEAIIEQLENELDKTRCELEQSVQDLESSNEELKSSNEELRSLNEEMQSANEELETSKEEIQAGMEALAHSRSDLENVLHGTRIATVFLDRNGNINSFTPTIRDIYRVRDGDIGRPLEDIAYRAYEMPALPSADEVAALDAPIEHEIQTDESRWFSRRVLPYVRDGQPGGLIVTFVDVSERKRAAMMLAAAHGVNRLLLGSETFEDVMPEILESVRSNLNAGMCGLWLVDSRSEELHCVDVASVAPTPELGALIDRTCEIRFRIGEGLPGKVWESRKPQWIENVAEDQTFSRSKLAAQANLISGMATPIISGKKFVGVIEFYTVRKLIREQSLLNMLREIGREVGQFIWQQKLDYKFRDEVARKTAVLDAALDCIVTMDVDGNIVDFNSVAEETFGFSLQQARGRPLSDLIIPERYREPHRQGFLRFLETGDSKILGKRLELQALRADGSEFPVELAVNASLTRDGVPFFTGYLRDISERRQSEAEIQEKQQQLMSVLVESEAAKAKLQVLFDQSMYFAGILDLDGNVVQVNQTALDQAGFDLGEMAGKPFWEVGWWSGSEDVRNRIKKAFVHALQGKVCQDELSYWLADGTERIADFAMSPVRNEAGNIIFVVPTGMDITQRRESEDREKREAEIEHFLSDAGVALASSLNYEETLAKVTQLSVPTLADWAFVDLLDPDG